MGKENILPDSRARSGSTILMGQAGTWVPIFCANCGKEGGAVPAENMTFVFWLCTACAETHGEIAGTMMMPDEVFFQKVKEEQLASYGRFLSEVELADVVAADASPLAALLKEGR